MRIRLQKGFFTSIVGLTLLAIVLAMVLTAAGVFTYYYVKYSRAITARLSGHVLQNTTQIFSAPQELAEGQPETLEALTTYLTRVGYRPEQDDNALGQFTVQGNTVDIRPSKLSYFAGGNALAVEFGAKSVRSIRPLGGGAALSSAQNRTGTDHQSFR